MIKATRSCPGFSLIEILTSVAILSIIIVSLATISNRVSQAWSTTASGGEQRIAARSLLDSLARELSSVPSPVPMAADLSPERNLQLLLNIPESTPSNGIGIPNALLNPHALFFQAPYARDTRGGTLAEIGYFVWWENASPGFYRHATDPVESGYSLYNPGSNWPASALPASRQKPDDKGWLSGEVIAFWARALNAEGVPITQTANRTTLNNGYGFDSQQGYIDPSTGAVVPPPAYPPCIEVALVVIDSRAAKRLQEKVTAAPLSPETFDKGPEVAGSLQHFMANLPEAIRSHAKVYSTRIYLSTSQK